MVWHTNSVAWPQCNRVSPGRGDAKSPDKNNPGVGFQQGNA